MRTLAVMLLLGVANGFHVTCMHPYIMHRASVRPARSRPLRNLALPLASTQVLASQGQAVLSVGGTALLSIKHSVFIAALVTIWVMCESALTQSQPRKAFSTWMMIAGQGLHTEASDHQETRTMGLLSKQALPSREELEDACYIISHKSAYHPRQRICWGQPSADLDDACVLDEELTQHYGNPVFHCMANA